MVGKEISFVGIREMPLGKRCELARTTRDKQVQMFFAEDERLVVRQSLSKNPNLYPEVHGILKGQRDLHLRT